MEEPYPMSDVDDAYIVGCKIARFGSATVPTKLVLTDETFDAMMAGWREEKERQNEEAERDSYSDTLSA